MKRSALASAPKRGHYDRALTPQARQAEQRTRLIAALVFVYETVEEPSVAHVVGQAGVGRNTFYEYFDDLGQARSSIVEQAQRDLITRVEREWELVLTPLGRVRALTRAWSDEIFEHPLPMRLALVASPVPRGASQVSAIGQSLMLLLQAQGGARAALPGLEDPLRVIAAAAVSDVLGRAHFVQNQLTRAELQRKLAELFLRILR